MKNTKLVTGLMALSMMASHAAFAQGINAAPAVGEQPPVIHPEQPRPHQPPPPPPGGVDRAPGERVMPPAPRHPAPPPAPHDRMPPPPAGAQQRMAPPPAPEGRLQERTESQGQQIPDLVPGSQATNASTGQVQLEKGRSLPQDYRSKQYIVSNWKDYQLQAPPRNHHWVQIGTRYVLVSNAGVIAEVQ